MGHEVDQRLVEVGESLDDYDEVIVFLAAPQQLLALATYNALWALHQRPSAILAFDDWQTDGIFKGIFSCRRPEELTREFVRDVHYDKTTLARAQAGELSSYMEALLHGATIASSKKSRMLISAFSGGDLQTLFPGEVSDKKNQAAGIIPQGYPPHLLFSYNPNPYHLNRGPGNYGDTEEENNEQSWPGFVAPADKRRQFNFASLVQGRTQKWLKTQGIDIKSESDEAFTCNGWNVTRYGWRKEGQDRLTEGQMCQVFAKDWGCLMPGYHHSASGWWRARPKQVSDAESILIGDETELKLYYGADYQVPLAIDLTEATTQELELLADQQRALINQRHPLDKAVQRAELERVLGAR